MRYRTALPTIVAGAALLTLTAACSSDSASDTTTAAPASVATTLAPTSDSTVAPATSGTTVDIAGFKFGPPELDIAVGDTVTWTNGDKQAHTATSSGTFDTGSIAPGTSTTVTFDASSTFAYICSFHPFMKATIVVT